MLSRREACGLLIVLPASLVVGCASRQPKYLIVLLDVSASIEPASVDASWQALFSLVTTMHRGDRLAIIPILKDADIDLAGSVLHLNVPSDRQPYDYDLIQFRSNAMKQLRELHEKAKSQPGAKTDLLGTLRAALEKIRLAPRGYRIVLIILSDYIQDDAQFDFRFDPQLRTPEDAGRLAEHLAGSKSHDFLLIRIYMGYLRSLDLRPLDQQRRAAIQRFWFHYFSVQGSKVTVAHDGVGSLPNFLESVETD